MRTSNAVPPIQTVNGSGGSLVTASRTRKIPAAQARQSRLSTVGRLVEPVLSTAPTGPASFLVPSREGSGVRVDSRPSLLCDMRPSNRSCLASSTAGKPSDSNPTAPVAWASTSGDPDAVRAAILGEGTGEESGCNGTGLAACSRDGSLTWRVGAVRLGRLRGVGMDKGDLETSLLAAGTTTGSRGGVAATVFGADSAMWSASATSGGRSGVTNSETNFGVGGAGSIVGVTSHASTTNHIVWRVAGRHGTHRQTAVVKRTSGIAVSPFRQSTSVVGRAQAGIPCPHPHRPLGRSVQPFDQFLEFFNLVCC